MVFGSFLEMSYVPGFDCIAFLQCPREGVMVAVASPEQEAGILIGTLFIFSRHETW